MNVITSQRTVSLFPRATFIHMKYILSFRPHLVTETDIHMWPVVRNSSGHSLFEDGQHLDREIASLRQVGDELCWILPNTVPEALHPGAHYKANPLSMTSTIFYRGPPSTRPIATSETHQSR